MLKKLYFVRHGETPQNKESKFMSGHEELSSVGIAQAQQVAKRFETIAIDAIICSPMARAHQTALPIAQSKNLAIEKVPSLGELSRPTSLHGKELFSDEGRSFKHSAWEHRHDASWHFEDEENIPEFIARLKVFKDLVEKSPHKNILAVTHGLTMKALVAIFVFPHLDASDFYMDAYERLYISNTGITEFEQKDDGTWILVTWNDQQHLG